MTNQPTALIICGALAREVVHLVEKYRWDTAVYAIPAHIHLTPTRIAPAVARNFHEISSRHTRTYVVFGDCGSYGALDEQLAQLNIQRIDGPHCYEMYGGDRFQTLLAEEPGTFFLTDFLVRTFHGTILKGLGLDRFPSLKETYFAHYTRLVYFTQFPDDSLQAKARDAAAYLGLPLEIHYTGLNHLEERLVTLMATEG